VRVLQLTYYFFVITVLVLASSLHGNNCSSLRRNPAESKRFFNQAFPLLQKKKVSQALPLLEKAVFLDSCNASALWETGWAYYLTDQWRGVVAVWDKVFEINPNTSGITLNLKMARDRAELLHHLDTLPPYIDKPVDTSQTRDSLVVCAVGDMQFGRSWPKDAVALHPQGARGIISNVRSLLSGDILFGNLETVLSDRGSSMKGTSSRANTYSFRAPTSYAKELAEMGFNALSLANNHSFDFKTAGMYATISAVEEAGINYSSKTGTLAKGMVRGSKWVMIAFDFKESAYSIDDTLAAKRLIQHLDEKFDIVIVSAHWGVEGAVAQRVTRQNEFLGGQNRGNPFVFARTAVDAGADMVLGHGPHVLRAIEVYKKRLIAYSLGNFCSYKSFATHGPMGHSGIVYAQIGTNGAIQKLSVQPIRFTPDGIPLPDPTKQAIATINELSAKDFPSTGVNLDSSGNQNFLLSKSP